jgi:hypothetical protein
VASTTLEEVNGHGRGEVDLHSTSPSPDSAGAGSSDEVTKPIHFRLPARRQFVAAAGRAKMSLKDAADLAAELLDRATQDERPETPAEKKARLANKVSSK